MELGPGPSPPPHPHPLKNRGGKAGDRKQPDPFQAHLPPPLSSPPTREGVQEDGGVLAPQGVGGNSGGFTVRFWGGGCHTHFQPRAELQSGGLGPPATCAPQLYLAPALGGGCAWGWAKRPPPAGDIWSPEQMRGGSSHPWAPPQWGGCWAQSGDGGGLPRHLKGLWGSPSSPRLPNPGPAGPPLCPPHPAAERGSPAKGGFPKLSLPPTAHKYPVKINGGWWWCCWCSEI